MTFRHLLVCDTIARVIIPFIPYIHSFCGFGNEAPLQFSRCFTFPPGVNLFHFTDFSILLQFFSFSVVTRLLFIHFFMHLVNLLCPVFVCMAFFLMLYSFFTFWHCYTKSVFSWFRRRQHSYQAGPQVADRGTPCNGVAANIQ